MTPVHLTDAASADLADIWAYIALDAPLRADIFLDKLVTTMENLAVRNRLGRPRPEIGAVVRSFVVGAYIIYYEPVSGGICVLRIVHGARRQPESL